MRVRFFPLLCVSVIGLLSPISGTYAQEGEGMEFIIDDRPATQIQVRPRRPDEPRRERPTQQVDQGETIRPEDIIVAIVNNRALTRAELNARLVERQEEVRERVAGQIGGIINMVNVQDRPDQLLAAIEEEEEREILEEQRRRVEQEMRREEEAVLQDWVIHSMLSDEARRQGFVIQESAFQRRLREEERRNEITADILNDALQTLQLSRADYERSVYDALMIEALLDRFIELNYTMEELRARYNQQPSLFQTPAIYRIAHWSLVFNGDESAQQIRASRELADRLRHELANNPDPAEVFARPEFNRITSGFSGNISGGHTFRDNLLPPVIAHATQRLREGETSRVLENQVRSGSRVRTQSLHVVKVLEITPPAGDTFESALPQIRAALLEIARQRVSERLFEARTHRVITNLGGIRAELIPTPEQMLLHEAQAQPINLAGIRNVSRQ